MTASAKFFGDSRTGLVIALAGAAVVVYLIVKNAANALVDSGKQAATAVGGLLTGNNVVTASATDAQGQPVDAYQGAGVLGTLGAATDELSGGFLATWGEDLGGWLYDTLNPSSNNPVNAAPEHSYSLQSSSNRPYNPQGNSNVSHLAQDGGTDPNYAATTLEWSDSTPLPPDPTFNGP